MSKLSKSPLRVACQALAVGSQTLPPYAHKFSPKKFTQPQLFACLVLKTFLKTDYRGVQEHLRDHSDLRAALALKQVPHFTTLQKASRRLLRLPKARRLFTATIRRFLKRRRRVRRSAMDSTGLDLGQASRYYIRRRRGDTKQWQTVAYSRFARREKRGEKRGRRREKGTQLFSLANRGKAQHRCAVSSAVPAGVPCNPGPTS